MGIGLLAGLSVSLELWGGGWGRHQWAPKRVLIPMMVIMLFVPLMRARCSVSGFWALSALNLVTALHRSHVTDEVAEA